MLIRGAKAALLPILLGACGVTVRAELYVSQDEHVRLTLKLPDLEDIPMLEMAKALESLQLDTKGLDCIHYDGVQEALEVLSLPPEIFVQHLSPTQLTEIIMNTAMDQVLDNTYLLKNGKNVKNKQAVRTKMDLLFRAFGSLTPANLGSMHDAVIARIPTSLYRHLRPLTVMASSAFKMTLRGFKSLFHITTRGLVRAGKRAASAVVTTFTLIRRLGITPLRTLQAVQVLLDLVVKYPEIEAMIPRVYLLAKEVDQLSHFVTGNAALLQTLGGQATTAAATTKGATIKSGAVATPPKEQRKRLPQGWTSWEMVRRRTDLSSKVRALIQDDGIALLKALSVSETKRGGHRRRHSTKRRKRNIFD